MPATLYLLALHGFTGVWRRRRGYCFLFLLTATALGGVSWAWWVIGHFHPITRWAFEPALPGLATGVVLLAAAFALGLWSTVSLPLRALAGLAQLFPGPQDRLIITGAYGLVRHPRYLGRVFTLLGIFLLTGQWLVGLVLALWAIALGPIIVLEERELTARFGNAYRQYQHRVPSLLPLRRIRGC